MRTFRNLSFVVFCFSFVYAGAATLRAECIAPGLVGLGDSEAEAIQDCNDYAQARCSHLCNKPHTCGTPDWEDWECNAIGSGTSWSASGHCVCGAPI
jgi:hypothetical protein